MKKGIYSNLLNCENKDKFTFAKDMGLNGIILDFNENTLYNLPNRNYYAFQSIKTELEIPALSVNQFKTVSIFGSEYLEETKNSLYQLIDIAEKMKVDMVILPIMEASQITTDEDLEKLIELLTEICPYGESNDVKIGIIEALNEDLREKLMGSVNSTNLISANGGFGEWTILESVEQLTQG